MPILSFPLKPYSPQYKRRIVGCRWRSVCGGVMHSWRHPHIEHSGSHKCRSSSPFPGPPQSSFFIVFYNSFMEGQPHIQSPNSSIWKRSSFSLTLGNNSLLNHIPSTTYLHLVTCLFSSIGVRVTPHHRQALYHQATCLSFISAVLFCPPHFLP